MHGASEANRARARAAGRTLRAAKPRPTIGWREWVGLPGLGVDRIKAKVDTGARTAALHAWNVEQFDRGAEVWVRFEVHPVQRDNRTRVICEAPLTGHKGVRNSGGHLEKRPVIVTQVSLGSRVWPIEVTLTNRDQMGFRMLLGRASVRGRFNVDPSTSFRGRKFAAAAKSGARTGTVRTKKPRKSSVRTKKHGFNERKSSS